SKYKSRSKFKNQSLSQKEPQARRRKSQPDRAETIAEQVASHAKSQNTTVMHIIMMMIATHLVNIRIPILQPPNTTAAKLMTSRSTKTLLQNQPVPVQETNKFRLVLAKVSNILVMVVDGFSPLLLL